MIKKLAGTVLVAAAATALIAAPANASSATATSVASVTTESEATLTAAAQLIRTRVSFGRCRDTCRINVRVKNISRKYLYNVRMNARLSINGRSVGTCTDYVGTVRSYGVRYAACTVRTNSLSNAYNDYLDGFTGFRYYARTNVSYRYYR
ncbi:hypothetical protein ETD86_23875 [Nonomuraea turkmeniaca]|uniref:Tat pathway signal sequence domain protein n=1 Tax=Nonomuraea turkmeniaca TaxID=103838 RepID=A0A5S4FEG7_9ACTN|nr:hypothetical protein [Nonomuraea turkmeniaca]TMR17092.1 hypothetical protein ETD86_23875 [Nonomuraea turkmeniaca]